MNATKTAKPTKAPPALTLANLTAAELMAPNPISIAASANVQEALVLLTDKNFSAAPVIDDGGRPIGVVSRSDLLVHDREVGRKIAVAEYFGERELPMPDGFQVENVDPTLVADIMTPAVFSVRVDERLERVVSEMIGLHVHRVFVVDDEGTLVGVISTMDVLKQIRS